ncbi:MAG: aspartate aminotransferase family protein [Actinomycetota bacterium]|nr:MAG: aspartate aminotransferase family protein [Actinomycetota bacterium]
MSALWHPFADMAAVGATGELSIVRGEGAYVWDAQGRRYLDAAGSLWYCNVGHGRSELARAAAEQLERLETYSIFQDLTNPPATELAERIAAIAPVRDAKVFFTSGGSDAIDTAVKITRRFWGLMGQPERRVLIRRERAYHGMHVAGTSLAGIRANLEGFGELLPDVVEVPWNDADALGDAIEHVGRERVAAFFCEPVIGAGGVFAPPEGYLEKARAICRDADVLFVADEVVTGFGRVGRWFASERWGLDPDLITCAKGVTSGYLPLGAVIVAPRVWEPFFAPGVGMFRHGYTYSGHATACAVGIANLDIVASEGLIERAQALEGELAVALAPLSDHELVSEVRAGTGVLAAVQVDPRALEEVPDLLDRVVPACRRHGIMTRMLAGGAIHVSPPLILTQAHVAELAEGLGAALDDLLAGR